MTTPIQVIGSPLLALRAQGARLPAPEGFADSRMGEVFIWRLFNQVAIRPFVWGEPTDTAAVERTLAEDVPRVLDYLETQLPRDGFVFGDVSIADVSIATFFRNAAFARFRVDAGRWPISAAFVERVLAIDAFARLRPIEEALMRVPPPRHRDPTARRHADMSGRVSRARRS